MASVASPGKADGVFPQNPPETSVSILEPIANRWSPVRFDRERKVKEEDLRGILEAARWAPSSFGEEPWRFIVARPGDPHRTALEECLSEGNAYARRAYILLATLAKSVFTRNGKANRFSLHDTGLATGALLIEATSRGLITHPMGGFDRRALRDAFRVPDDFEPVAMVAVGYHASHLRDEKLERRESRPRKRRSLQESVFGASFGVALDLS